MKGGIEIMEYVLTALFILIDILSGLLKSLKMKTWSSTTMREGLFHKMGFVIIIALAVLCDYGQRYLGIGFVIPITKAVCVYVIVTEIGSVVENVSAINPTLVDARIKAFFIKVK